MPPEHGTKTTNVVKENDSESESSSEHIEEHERDRKSLSKSHVYVDRDEYLQAHRDLNYDRSQLQIKNNILHRKLAEYYKKRKMEHVLKPLENSHDLEEKYQEKLLAYEELKENDERETETIRVKLEEVTNIYDKQEEAAKAKFKALQDHERNTGSGLIYAQKGKPIHEKTVQRSLALQKSKTATASAMMLKYIRVRNAVMEQEVIIKNLERIGPGLYVRQFEQLRVDQQNYTSKIEERDDELIRNRTKYYEQNQMLAHVREKMHFNCELIGITECDVGDAEIAYQLARGELNVKKTRRDKLRITTENERLKAGLITKKLLLRDFEDSLELMKKMRDRKAHLEHLIAKYNMELRRARKCIINSSQGQSSSSDDLFMVD